MFICQKYNHTQPAGQAVTQLRTSYTNQVGKDREGFDKALIGPIIESPNQEGSSYK